MAWKRHRGRRPRGGVLMVFPHPGLMRALGAMVQGERLTLDAADDLRLSERAVLMGVTRIEWTSTVRPDGTATPGYTFNPWRGCTKVSAGCANCYAETLSGRNPKTLGVWGPNGTRVVAAESKWREPLKWDAAAKKAGERHRVFCASLADVFEDWRGPMVDAKGEVLYRYEDGFAPLDSRADIVSREFGWSRNSNRSGRPGSCLTMQDVRERLFRLIDATPNLDWLLLTKRPENVLRMTYDAWCERVPGHVSQNEGDGRRWAFPPNVWLGTSVEDQKAADERIPHLLRCPAAVRFLSMEPLLGPVSLSPYRDQAGGVVVTQGIDCDWVIVGGESGPDARTCRVEWVRSVVDQCKAAGVPCFVKQLGASVTTTLPDGEAWPGHTGPTSPVQFSGDGFGNYHVSGLRDKKGGDPAEWPSDLRVREFPRPVANTEGR